MGKSELLVAEPWTWIARKVFLFSICPFGPKWKVPLSITPAAQASKCIARGSKQGYPSLNVYNVG